MKENFAGKDGFYWWTGVVEDRQDPIKLGRCRVRIVGWHSNNKMELPTESLPWSIPMLPTNNTHPYAPREGERVFGFFADGEAGQHPIIMGVFPTIPLGEPNSNNAFSDARTEDQLKSSPRSPKNRTYNLDGSGITLEESEKAQLYPFNLDEPSTSRLARNDADYQSSHITERKNNIVTVNTISGTWKEPESAYQTKYPYSKVIESESGHIFEADDTPGAERIMLSHRSGSFVEYFPEGTVLSKVVKDNYSIIMGSDRIYVMGKCQVTIQGDSEVFIQGNADMKVSGNFEMNVDGTCKINSDGNMSLTAPRIDLN